MEEDIKRIEHLIERCNQCKLNDKEKEAIEKLKWYFKDSPTLDITKNVNIVLNLIENLLTRYKQLEEKLDNSRKANELLNKTNNELRWGKRTAYSKAVNDIISKFNLGDEYIPKSKIQEKIEEYKKVIEITEEQLKYEENVDVRRRYTTTIEQATAGILVLQELLEEE